MPDSRSRRFATWAFSFKPLGGNLRIAAATHISAFFVPKSRNRERTHPAGSPAQANRDRAASRRAFGGPHPAGEPKPRKSVTSFESLSLGEVFYPRNHGKRSLQLGETRSLARCPTAGATGSEALSSGGRNSEEPAAGETRRSGNPQPGSPLPAEFARPQKLPCKPQPCRDFRGVPQNEDDED